MTDSTAGKFDPVWEEKYASGQVQRYPWDIVVSFVFRHAPKDRPRETVKILEVGFGSGSNLWFAAREGFSVAGIEGSSSAVAHAKKRFAEEGLEGDLRQGDFTDLPFENATFDLVIDRGSLTCVGRARHVSAIDEIARVLKPGGLFHYNGYADSHSSYRAGEQAEDGMIANIAGGSLTGVGQIFFTSRTDIDGFFAQGWKLHSVQRREWTDMLEARGEVHAEWQVIAEKTDT